MPQEFFNVREAWPYFDTLIVSRELYGSEQNVGGFFTTFNAFTQRQEHSLFKIRSESLVGLMYNNQSTQDRLEFPFHAFSLGISFFAPSFMPQWIGDIPTPPTAINNDQIMSSFWCLDLPRLIGVEFRIGQDVKLTGTPFRLPPGYGPAGGGVGQAVQHHDNDATPAEPLVMQNQMVVAMNQGSPDISNRFTFRPPLGIPRTETIEVKILISDIAKNILDRLWGPGYMTIPQSVTVGEIDSWSHKEVPCRFGIQASLWGVREVQQRGALHA